MFDPTATIRRRVRTSTGASNMSNFQPPSHRQKNRLNDTCPFPKHPLPSKPQHLSFPCIFTYQNCPSFTRPHNPQNPSKILPPTIRHKKIHPLHLRRHRLSVSNHNFRQRRHSALPHRLHVLRSRPFVGNDAEMTSTGVASGDGEADARGYRTSVRPSLDDEFCVPAGGHGGEKFRDAEFAVNLALQQKGNEIYSFFF